MIYGIGIDVVEPGRVARLVSRYGERFARRVLTALEWGAYLRSPRPVMFIANRFAAKEAFSKAMGTGFRYPVSLQFISVVSNAAGKPGLQLDPQLECFVRGQGIVREHLTISDESSMACACVVLEAVPAVGGTATA